jgi:hypothetical protein
MSAVASRLGADCSLLVSPLKVSWHPDDELELVLGLELLPDIAGLSKLHGTATCLPELEDVSLVLVDGVVNDGLVDDELEDGLVDDDELDEPELLSEITANSTLPEFGLMMVSLIVPRLSPDEDCTEQLLSCDARIA